VWHVLICAAAAALGLLVGWIRGHYAGYHAGRTDGVMENIEMREIDAELRRPDRG
jgi:ABC-type dipeptide/oligopeptide/nickel transport system permease subunit